MYFLFIDLSDKKNMADFTDKVVGVAVGLSIAVSLLISTIAPQIVEAQADENLSTYAAIIGIIMLVFIFGLVMYVWKTMKHN